MKLAWLTDIHLDQVTGGEIERLAASTAASSDACVITGDISNAAQLSDDLLSFTRNYSKPVYFVLGNHDYYGSSFLQVNERVANLGWGPYQLAWLDTDSPIALTEETELCGIGGWYDAEYGHGLQSQVRLTDFSAIYEIMRACVARRLHAELKALAKAAAAAAESQLRRTRAREVIFATHVPPFPENSVYQGKQSDDHFLPFFTSSNDPATRSSHGSATHQPPPNLVCHTGVAEYGRPQVERVLEV